MDLDIQKFIVKGVLENKSFFVKVINNLQADYFTEEYNPIVKAISKYHQKYDKIPNYTVVSTILSSADYQTSLMDKINNSLFGAKDLDFDPKKEVDWLFDETKQFINDRAVFKVLQEGAHELNKDENKRDYGDIANKMQKATSIDWDEDLGFEYSDLIELDERYDRLSDSTKRIPTGIGKIDEAIGGGILGETKFLALFAGSAGLGKTLILGNTAVNAVKDGKNVLYVTFEISQDELGKRMDSAFTGLSIANITKMRDEVKRRITDEYSTGKMGRMIIKEYPPSSVNANEVEALINQLRMKRDFKPDIVVLDYLGIMKPIATNVANSYEKGKFVSEELRALSSRLNCPIFSATQYNRSGYNKESVDLDAMADSMAIAHTADLVISLTQTEEDSENSIVRFDITKSRVSKKGTKGKIQVNYETLKVENEGEKTDEEVSSVIDKLKNVKSEEKIKNTSGIK
jgi:archaellum biogenesis ATPase FlaH